MHVSRGIFDVETTIRKLNSRFRRPSQISQPEWPVISAVRPLFYLLRFAGLVPFGISRDHFISRSYDVIYSLFCTLVYIYFFYTVLVKTGLNRDTVILDVMETAKIVLNDFVVVFSLLMSVWTRKEFIKVLNIIKNFDSRIRDLGYPRTEGAAKVWAWSTCICTAFLWTIVSRLGMIAFNEYWIDNVRYLLCYMATWFTTIKFCSVSLLLGQRFRYLNDIAKLRKEYGTNKRKYIPIHSKGIQEMHLDLMNAGESLSSQYAWSLLLWLINLCVHSVSNIYFLIDWILDTPEWSEEPLLLINCLSSWLVTYIIQLLLLHITCHFTSSEANHMRWIVLNWKNLAESRNYSVESSLLLINRKLNFTAAGCFPVDLPLLRSITALLTTYLVLLKQFQSYK